MIYRLNNKALSLLPAHQRRTKRRKTKMTMTMTEKQVTATSKGHKSLTHAELNERCNDGLANQERLRRIFPFLAEDEGYF